MLDSSNTITTNKLRHILRGRILNIRGNSYRMRRYMELSKAIHPTASRAIPAGHAGAGS